MEWKVKIEITYPFGETKTICKEFRHINDRSNYMNSLPKKYPDCKIMATVVIFNSLRCSYRVNGRYFATTSTKIWAESNKSGYDCAKAFDLLFDRDSAQRLKYKFNLIQKRQ